MNILAINPGHNGSICLLKDGKVELFVEEERITRQKYDGNPLRTLYDILKTTKIDMLVLGGTDVHMYPIQTWSRNDPYTDAVTRYCPNVKVMLMTEHHHVGHAAAAFYNSGFDSAAAIIVDGAGSMIEYDIETESKHKIVGYETESIFHFDYTEGVKVVYKSLGHNEGPTVYSDDGKIRFNGSVNITKAYEASTLYAGFLPIEAGKLMGLSSYGGPNSDIPELFIGENANRNIFFATYPNGGYVNVHAHPKIKLSETQSTEFIGKIDRISKNPNDLKLVQDFAWKIQQDTQRLVGDLIQKAIDFTGEKNIVISGGYGLNCVANYYYKKRFPEINLFVDPISSDAGTALGLAKLFWFEHCRENNITPEKSPLTTLYLGKDRNDEIEVAKYEDEFITHEATPDSVAKLISEENIVALFNGRAEAGPRALGNRSILFDPRVKNGKDIVNVVKGREWFRPFAGSILKEHANEWFDMAGLEESPYMMYAVDVLPERIGQVDSITHVDNTCRIQTVTHEQNEHYYNLIDAFNKLTGVPILFNTSFNLAGDPLVETFEDAINTLKNSKLKYLYIPSKKILLEKKDGTI
jgi:carbamoyltransferase